MKKIDKVNQFINKELEIYSKEIYIKNKSIYNVLLIDDEYKNLLEELTKLYFYKYLSETSYDEEQFVTNKSDLLLKIDNISNENEYLNYDNELNKAKEEFKNQPFPFTLNYYKLLEKICILQAYKYMIESSNKYITYTINIDSFYKCYIIGVLNNILYKNINNYEEEINRVEELIQKRVKKADRMYSACSRCEITNNYMKQKRQEALKKYSEDRSRKRFVK